MNEIHKLTHRLEVLESRHNRLQRILALVLLAGGALMMMGQVPARPPFDRPLPPDGTNQQQLPRESKIRAEAFILVDEKGQERASLVTDGGGSVFLVMFDKSGKPRAD